MEFKMLFNSVSPPELHRILSEYLYSNVFVELIGGSRYVGYMRSVDKYCNLVLIVANDSMDAANSVFIRGGSILLIFKIEKEAGKEEAEVEETKKKEAG